MLAACCSAPPHALLALGVSARCAAGLSGCAPCRLCRHGHSASIPHAFAPAALRAGACLQGIGARPIPAALHLAPLQKSRTGSAGSAKQVPSRNGRGAGVTPWFAAAGCADACRPQRCWFLPLTSRRTVHGQPARHRYGASTPRLKTCAERCGKGVLACRWVVDLARVRGRAGEAFGRGCRAGPISFRSGSAQGVLVSL